VRKIAGALAAGCSIIIKASEETPGGCVELVKCFADAGVPAGVLNLVFGVPAEVSEHLIASDIVKKISFTGSIPVGKLLAGLAAKGMKKATMELGGHFAGHRVRRCRRGEGGRYHRGVQVSQCRAGLHLADPLLRAGRLLQEVLAPLHRIRQGPEGSATAWRKRPRWARSPIRAGSTPWSRSSTTPSRAAARCRPAAPGHGNQGFFFEPTVITDLPDDSKLMTTEPFGPVAPIVPFKTFDEVVERANSLSTAWRPTPSHHRPRRRMRSATPSSPA
jgi:succinate-semialdehyde dehydrogenase/glutarate-semialdehyde dehydrogenase